jgi:hypothetical protein
VVRIGDERLPQRFWDKVREDAVSDCWLWTACVGSHGYGLFFLNEPRQLTHRVAYEHLVGPIPEGLVIDHVAARGCVHRNCVNPAHMEVVTHTVNTLRGSGATAVNAAKTHCKRGHPLAGANLSIVAGRRRCKTCHRLRQRKYQASMG